MADREADCEGTPSATHSRDPNRCTLWQVKVPPRGEGEASSESEEVFYARIETALEGSFPGWNSHAREGDMVRNDGENDYRTTGVYFVYRKADENGDALDELCVGPLDYATDEHGDVPDCWTCPYPFPFEYWQSFSNWHGWHIINGRSQTWCGFVKSPEGEEEMSFITLNDLSPWYLVQEDKGDPNSWRLLESHPEHHDDQDAIDDTENWKCVIIEARERWMMFLDDENMHVLSAMALGLEPLYAMTLSTYTKLVSGDASPGPLLLTKRSKLEKDQPDLPCIFHYIAKQHHIPIERVVIAASDDRRMYLTREGFSEGGGRQGHGEGVEEDDT